MPHLKKITWWQRHATPWERRLFLDSVHWQITSTFETNQNTYKMTCDSKINWFGNIWRLRLLMGIAVPYVLKQEVLRGKYFVFSVILIFRVYSPTNFDDICFVFLLKYFVHSIPKNLVCFLLKTKREKTQHKKKLKVWFWWVFFLYIPYEIFCLHFPKFDIVLMVSEIKRVKGSSIHLV